MRKPTTPPTAWMPSDSVDICVLLTLYSPFGVSFTHPLGENRQAFVCDWSRSERTNLGRFVGRIGWSDCDGRTEITGFEAMRAAGTNAKPLFGILVASQGLEPRTQGL